MVPSVDRLRPHRSRLTGRSSPPPRREWRWRSLIGAVVVAGTIVVTSGCVGQRSRNDDHVGPHSPRPDAREHTLAPLPG